MRMLMASSRRCLIIQAEGVAFLGLSSLKLSAAGCEQGDCFEFVSLKQKQIIC